MPNLRAFLAATVACAALALPALAQDADPMMAPKAPAARPKPAAKPAKPSNPEDDALAGPKVDKTPTGKTLIERNFDGSLVKLDERPEQAAIALLALTPEQKKEVDALFVTRAKAVSKILYDHFDTFLAVQAARQGGAFRPGGDAKEREQLGPKMKEIRDAADEAGLMRPVLVEQVAEKLPEDQASEYRRLVSEYLAALQADVQKEMGTQGAFSRPGNAEGVTRRGPGADQRQEMNMFLREVARTLGAQVQARKEQTEALFKAVDATPEQQAQIEKILRAVGEENRAKKGNPQPTPEQRAATFKKIMDVLTPEQREKARERLREP